MSRHHNEAGGGAQTNANGLSFESQVALSTLIPSWNNSFSVQGHDLVFQYPNGQSFYVAKLFSKEKFWNDFFEPRFPNLFTVDDNHRKVVKHNIWSKMLKPDEVLIVETSDGPFFLIIEAKTQGGGGSADEKLQTSLFKKSQYSRFLDAAFGEDKYSLHFVYFLDNWFANEQNSFACIDPNTQLINFINIPKYRDCFNYILEVGDWYYFPQMSNHSSRHCIEELKKYIRNVLHCSVAWPTMPQTQPPFQFL